MPFDRGDTNFKLFALVDFAFLELREVRIEPVNLRVEFVDAAIEPPFERAEVLFGRHVLDDVAEHFTEFFGRSFLGGHMAAVYHTARMADDRSRIMEFEGADFGWLGGHGFWMDRSRKVEG